MTNAMQEKFNSGFLMRPYSFFHAGAHPTRTETMLRGWVYSMTRTDEQECRFGYAGFAQKFGVARSTVARIVRKLVGAGVIARKRAGGQKSCYTYTAEAPATSHVRTEVWFYTSKFTVAGDVRHLTNAEIDVLSLIYTHTRNKDKKRYEGSVRDIAGILNVAEKTVMRAITALFAADLISRPTLGQNGSVKSVFVANMKVMRRLDKEAKKAEKAKGTELPADVVNANARADRERFFAERRQRAFSLMDHFVAKASKNARFVELDRALNRMEYELAKAEVRDPASLPALQAKQTSMRAERARILDDLGIEEWQLKPQFVCETCEDTGFRLTDGVACACYNCRR